MVRRYLLLILVVIFAFPGCRVIRGIDKDIPIEEMDQLDEEYIGRTVWTRALLIDLGNEGIIDRDTQVEIVGLDMHWNGAVTVKGPNRRKIRHGMNLEKPVTKDAFEEKLNKIFWFKKPEYRYRMDLRKYGKRTAKSIFNHELFKGMDRQAALESWGFPDEMKENELGGVLNEQWIYIDTRQKNKKRYVWLVEGVVDKWEE